MAIILEIKSGPLTRKALRISSGQSLLVGRDSKRGAEFVIPDDSHMSGVHFTVECGPSGCRVIDKKSTNGTFLNGARIQEAMLASGDEIKSGQTVFVVRIVPDDQLPAASSISQTASPAQAGAPKELPTPMSSPVAGPASAAPRPPVATPAPSPLPERGYRAVEQPASSPAGQGAKAPLPAPSVHVPKPPQAGVGPQSRAGQPPALAIGSWAFARIPEGWKIQEGLGIQLDVKDEKVFSSNIGAMEEPLGPGITLSTYVEAQTKMFREYLREPKIDATLPPKIPGATETIALEVRFTTKDGPAVYYQRVYARGGPTIGVLTLTTLEKDLSSVRPAYDSFLAGASFSARS